MFQNLDGDHIFHAHAHRMSREPFGIGDNQFIGGVAKRLAQRHHFSGRTAPSGGRKGLMGHKHRLRGHGVAIQTKAAFGRSDQIVHHRSNVFYIQPCAVEGAVVGLAAEQFHQAAHAPFAHRIFAFHDEGTGAHAHNRAMASFIKGQRRMIHPIFGGGRAHSQEAGAHPGHQVIACDIICADHDHTPTTAVPNPIFGERHPLCRAGAGRIDLRIGSASADILSKLAVTHRQNAEQEAAVKAVRFPLQRPAQFADASGKFQLGLVVGRFLAQLFQHVQLFHPIGIGVVSAERFGKAVAAREGAGKNDARLIAQRTGQFPILRQHLARGRRFIALNQRNAGFAQGIQTRGHGQLGGDVQRLNQLAVHAILFRQVEIARPTGQLDDLGRVIQYDKLARAIFPFHQAGDAFIHHALAEPLWNQIHKLLAAQNTQGILRVHHRLLRAWQTQPRATDDDGAVGWCVAVVCLIRDWSLEIGLLECLCQELA